MSNSPRRPGQVDAAGTQAALSEASDPGGRASRTRTRVGIGGWNFAPWRKNFYPEGLAQKRELEYASRRLSSIEINSTFYGSQKPESFARWREEVPDTFVFSVKGPRYATNRSRLAEAAPSIERFFASGVLELGDKLGPINWQFPPTKQFDRDDVETFLGLLPRHLGGRELRHVVEVRHGSFELPELIEILRQHEIGLVFTDKEGVPHLHDLTAPFVYLRLERSAEDEPIGYPADALDRWAQRIRQWANGGEPDGLARLAPEAVRAREVFVYFINGFKPRAPAAAMALLERLSGKAAGEGGGDGR
jgi:uncharacterized protein YecE (DUF72 family)